MHALPDVVYGVSSCSQAFEWLLEMRSIPVWFRLVVRVCGDPWACGAGRRDVAMDEKMKSEFY